MTSLFSHKEKGKEKNARTPFLMGEEKEGEVKRKKGGAQ
jgi:hypothetical protein